MKKFTALFDLDGVVFDTENNYTNFWTNVGKRYLPDIQDFASIIKGHSITDILSTYFTAWQQDWEKIEHELYDMEKNMSFPYIPGVEIFIRKLQKANISTCLVTSSDTIKMQTVIRSRPEIQDYFPSMVTAADVSHAKPHPECYLMGAQKSKTDVKDCIVFEDSFAGITAGKAAGMKVVALATTNSRQSLQNKAELIIDNFNNLEIKDILSLMQ